MAEIARDSLDLFAGPGGWDEGVRPLGLRPLGLETDAAACETRAAAGHRTRLADVAECDPHDFAPCELLLASPPCPAFSQAGKRGGMRDLPIIYGCGEALLEGVDDRAARRPLLEDETSLLVVEPLRYAVALRPKLIAWEQVPPVLPFWQWCAGALAQLGYRSWVGILSAEQYGVPQTRSRAFLLASRASVVTPPPPTHRAYVPSRADDGGGTMQLFDPPPVVPVVLPGEDELLPWVSMAEALGWGATARPYPVIASSRTTGGPDREKVGGSGARQVLYDEQAAGRWSVNTGRDWQAGGSRADAQTIDAASQPAPSVDGKGRWHVDVVRTGNFTAKTHRGERGRTYEREVEAPAPTLTGNAGAWQVAAHDRPATTVQGDPRIAQPGHKRESSAPDSPGRMEGAIRVSIEDAAVLQGFPADYPFQGNSSQRFSQVGNAVPPPLAQAVVAALLSGARERRSV